MRTLRLLTSFAIVVFILAASIVSHAQEDVSISFNLFTPPPVAVAPPPLPVYVVPEPPAEGFFWVPGHWLWNGYDYFWVPGTWVQPPYAGLLWTPGYWEWQDDMFVWHEGYWARHVGFYGGIAYGGGYDGYGFHGGEWHRDTYVVNRTVVNVTNITNITNVTTTSFNGGPEGTAARPTRQQLAALHEKHDPPTQAQVEHIHTAARDPALTVSENHGKPQVAATAKPANFTQAVPAKQAGIINPEVKKHNEEVLDNPAIAKGAALPAPRSPQTVMPSAQHLKPESDQLPKSVPVQPDPEHNSPPVQSFRQPIEKNNPWPQPSRTYPPERSGKENAPVLQNGEYPAVQRRGQPVLRERENAAPSRTEQPPSVQPQTAPAKENVAPHPAEQAPREHPQKEPSGSDKEKKEEPHQNQ